MLKDLLDDFLALVKRLLGDHSEDITERVDLQIKRKATSLSDSELESTILDYAKEYFKYIGEDHFEVMEFKTAVDTGNIPLIVEKWSEYANRFVSYERQAGHKSRPLIMDYYFTYEHYLEEYEKRKLNKS